MGKMKDIAVDIEEMLTNGYDVEDIAMILEVDIKLVKDCAKTLGHTENDSSIDL
jgi:hypothetical protein